MLAQHLRKIFDFVLMPIPAAVGIFIGGLIVFFGGFFLTQSAPTLLDVIKEGYSNFGIELVSIAITVLIIDRLNQRRADRERLQELITQMRSKDNALALAAVEIMRLKGWMSSGALKGASLREANLKGADLRGVNLSDIDLRGADLCDVDLNGANLKGATLLETNLSEADLIGADLSESNLRGANLSEANLRGANLINANLTGANLSEANLARASLNGTIFDQETILPDGSNWVEKRDMMNFTDPSEWLRVINKITQPGDQN